MSTLKTTLEHFVFGEATFISVRVIITKSNQNLSRYVEICQKICYHSGYIIEDYQDIGFAEIQRWFSVYAFDEPFFYQTSGYHGTVNSLTSYPTEECFNYNKNYFLPERIV